VRAPTHGLGAELIEQLVDAALDRPLSAIDSGSSSRRSRRRSRAARDVRRVLEHSTNGGRRAAPRELELVDDEVVRERIEADVDLAHDGHVGTSFVRSWPPQTRPPRGQILRAPQSHRELATTASSRTPAMLHIVLQLGERPRVDRVGGADLASRRASNRCSRRSHRKPPDPSENRRITRGVVAVVGETPSRARPAGLFEHDLVQRAVDPSGTGPSRRHEEDEALGGIAAPLEAFSSVPA